MASYGCRRSPNRILVLEPCRRTGRHYEHSRQQRPHSLWHRYYYHRHRHPSHPFETTIPTLPPPPCILGCHVTQSEINKHTIHTEGTKPPPLEPFSKLRKVPIDIQSINAQYMRDMRTSSPTRRKVTANQVPVTCHCSHIFASTGNHHGTLPQAVFHCAPPASSPKTADQPGGGRTAT
jgi:hypothetical protein